ncbi:MAG TPA: histidine phosphatase family protein [Solirubrobacteraceae bacterium]|jgi:broad specificity phosphatase PhoE|nr:histidine phosphatase family protein [Solirubrobacteraceae bacterium]
MTPANVYLARHGQTAYNLERRFQGHLPVPLDDTGREQAADLAERAAVGTGDGASFVALWSSPLLRARETADIVAARLGLEPREEPRLMETDAGDWTDRLFTDVQAEDPDGFAGFIEGRPDFGFPGGESFAQQGVRVAAALADVERSDLPALVVSHGVVIRIALFQRAGHKIALAERVPNAALVPLDPTEAEHADVGGGEALPPS